MLKHSVRNRDSRTHIYLSLLLVAVVAAPIAGWSLIFTLPADVALRIRLDDTLTSTVSRLAIRSAQPLSIGASTKTLESTDTSAASQRRED